MIFFDEKSALNIQNDIYLLTLDDFSPHGIVGGMSDDPDLFQWQYAVEIIYRCLVAGLWGVRNEEWLVDNKIKDYKMFCCGLSGFNPFKLSDQGEVYWLEPMIYGKDASFDLVERFGIDMISKDCCNSFIEEVERIFAKCGVSLALGNIFPVKI